MPLNEKLATWSAVLRQLGFTPNQVRKGTEAYDVAKAEYARVLKAQYVEKHKGGGVEDWSKALQLKKGALSSKGYKASKSVAQRHQALDRAVVADGRDKTAKRLTVIANLDVNKPIGRIFQEDAAWVRRKTKMGELKKVGGGIELVDVRDFPVVNGLGAKHKGWGLATFRRDGFRALLLTPPKTVTRNVDQLNGVLKGFSPPVHALKVLGVKRVLTLEPSEATDQQLRLIGVHLVDEFIQRL